jgi:hypothetical protein
MIQYVGTVDNRVDVEFDFIRCNKMVFRENELGISRIRIMKRVDGGSFRRRL